MSSGIRKDKKEAKRLLTKFIRDIANEMHEEPEVTGPGIDDARMVTKAEALARYIWRAGLGYKHTVDVIDKVTGQVVGQKEQIFYPDKHFIDILLDRMEGKVPNIEAKDENRKATVADKVSSEGKKRLNKLAH